MDKLVPNSSTERTINYVGFLSNEGEISLFLPKGMVADGDQTPARLLYKCIRQYERSANLGWGNTSLEGISIPHGVRILENYISQGLYSATEKKYQRRFGGKIDWTKTIKQVAPQLTQSNVPIYMPPVTSQQKINPDAIVQIHRAIVNEADQQLGWLVSNNGCLIAPHLSKSALVFSRQKAIKLLRSELSHQYEDDKLVQLTLMIDYLQQNIDQGEQSSWRLGTTNFHVLWEQICSDVFGNQKDKFPIPSVPAYQTKNSTLVRPENGPKPDIVISDEKKIAIIDAKYYDFSKSKPSWADMVKQFFYAKAYTLKYQDKEIDNVFAVPAVDNTSAEKVVVVNDEGKFLHSDFPPIKILYLNVSDMITFFTQRKRNFDARSWVF